MQDTIKHLLNPSAITIMGATEGEHRIGGRVMHYILRAGFKGEIYPVNPGRETVQGIKAYPRIEDVPGTADCAILAIPAAAVIDALRSCVTKGVKAAVLFSAGFAELGDEGAAMQAELAAVAKEAGIRILGPNCLGAFSAHSGFMATFSSNIIDKTPEPGSVGIVSQSGAFGAHLYSLCDARGIGISYWVTTGNEADITIADCIAFMANAPDVNTIMVYAEGINDPEGLAVALQLAHKNRKPVIFLKVGRTEAGAKAAASHTASLAVSDTTVEAFLKRYGAYRAETTDEMIELAYACQGGVFPASNRIGLLTISGGVGVQMADLCVAECLDAPEFPEDLQRQITEMLPFASATNPVDMTAVVVEKPELLLKTFELVGGSAEVDAIATFLTPIAAREEVIDGLAQWSRTHGCGRPIALCAPVSVEIQRKYEEAGMLFFDTPDKIIRAFAALDGFRRSFDWIYGEPSDAPKNARALSSEPVNEVEAKAILQSWGIGVVQERLVTSAEEAVETAAGFGGPVVLKIASPEITHKTEVGGVLLNVEGAEAVSEAYATLISRTNDARPDANIDGVIVSEMLSDGVETVIGVQNDPTFGPVVMFGLGGVFVEVLKEVSFRLAPFSEDVAFDMIYQTKGHEMLDGVRGAPSADVQALAEALARVSVFAAENADIIDTVDLNPFLVSAEGAVALDALIVPKQSGTT